MDHANMVPVVTPPELLEEDTSPKPKPELLLLTKRKIEEGEIIVINSNPMANSQDEGKEEFIFSSIRHSRIELNCFWGLLFI